MIISTFLDPESGQLVYHEPGDDTIYGYSIDSWLGTYTRDLTERFEAEGLGRELTEARITLVSEDRCILDLRVRYSDGRSVGVKTSVLIARFNQGGGASRIASIGGVAASQS